MRNRWKVHVPVQVVYEAARFLVFLRDYRIVVHGPAHSWDGRFQMDRKTFATKVWVEQLSKPGRKLLQVGNDWAMTEWTHKRPEWTRQLQSLFSYQLEPIQDNMLEWGTALSWFLAEGDGHREPMAFRAGERNDNWYRREGMFRDVELDVRALVAAANERASRDLANPKPLTELQKEVLELIPQGTSEGISGKEIVRKLAHLSLVQSTLTSHVIPVLKQYYGVCNERSVGYFRMLPIR